jgi:hypothetical protein
VITAVRPFQSPIKTFLLARGTFMHASTGMPPRPAREAQHRRGDGLQETKPMTPEEATAVAAVRRTIHAYSAAGDARDAALYRTLWAEDAVLDFAGFGPVPAFRCEGAADIAARTAAWVQPAEQDPSIAPAGFIRHNLTTCHSELTGADTAQARTYFLAMTRIGPDHAGVYADRLVRRGTDWLFAERRITLDWRSPESLFPPLPR